MEIEQTCGSVSIVNFEHVIAGWVSTCCREEGNSLLFESIQDVLFYLTAAILQQ